MFNFGSGNVFAVRTDIANAAPVLLGTLQDVSVDFQFTQKELMGQNQFPVDVARSSGKITGKAKAAKIDATTLNNLFFGQTVTKGSSIRAQVNEAGSVPAAAAYTINVANAATWSQDLGVVYANTGARLTPVAAAPAAGQYTVANGVYTFAAADANAAVQISYEYSSNTSGNKIAITNQLQGASPVFKLVLTSTYAGKTITLELNACKSTKLSMDMKNEDYTIPEFDFSAYADAANNIGTVSVDDL